jgi:hypothetical protein
MGIALKTAKIILILTLSHNIITRGVAMRLHEPGEAEATTRNTMADTAARAKLVNMPERDTQIISLLGFLRL